MTAPDPTRSKQLPLWPVVLGMWLLLTLVFSTQLTLAGYVTPWPRAIAAEGIYWLSWGALAPAVFWICRHTYQRGWSIYLPVLAAGFFATVILSPMIANALHAAQQATGLCIGDCDRVFDPVSREMLGHIMSVAGINLPVYAGFVLAWHAATYYRESRDRQLREVQLESQLNQAQLQALRSQINPHFLFNALHSIAELVHRDPTLAERLIVRLGELLRQALSTSAQPEVPLGEEIEFIRGYLDIERMRLGDRLTVEWDIDDAALNLRLPSLLLQPLVENAIQHGVAPHTAPGKVRVTAKREGATLRLEVRDSGPGIAAEEFERQRGIGLTNTRTRLERMYGARAQLECERNGGCLIRVRLPAAPMSSS